MTFLKSVAVAFAMYSKIPMPDVKWEEKNMGYAICAFPLVGALIGAALIGFYTLCNIYSMGTLFFSCGILVIPLAITGGIHMDGYMDTMDALHSYENRERKLEILKDPHVGAFAILMMTIYLLLFGGSVSEIYSRTGVFFLGCGQILSRIFSAIAVICFPNAKKEGTLYAFSSNTQKQRGKWILCGEGVLVCAGMLCWNLRISSLLIMAGCLWFFVYQKKSQKEFGGITGDLAGWFLVIYELIFAMVLCGCKMGGWI